MIGSSSKLLKLYCYGVAPCVFPSYVYRTSVYKPLFQKYRSDFAGKHADVAMMLEGVGIRPIYCIAKPLMSVRIHEGADSYRQSISQRKLLINNMSRITGYRITSRGLKHFRIADLTAYLRADLRGPRKKTHSLLIVIRYLISNLDIVVQQQVGRTFKQMRAQINVRNKVTQSLRSHDRPDQDTNR